MLHFFLLFAFHNVKINALQGVTQARRQEFAVWGEGVLWRLETTSNDLDLNFDRYSIELVGFCSQILVISNKKKRYPPKLGRFFCPNLRDLKKKKKKVFSQAETQFFVRIYI